jgi:phosphatidylglycerophosphate synthase
VYRALYNPGNFMPPQPSQRWPITAIYRNIPNAISACRLLAVPFLLAFVVWKDQEKFKWLLLACLLSDILDGLIARLFRLRSRLGAALDSTADILVFFIALAGIFVFQREFLAAHYKGLFVVVTLLVAEAAAAIWRYGRISSFHTVLNRIAAYSQGIFVMSLFLWGYHAWVFQAMIGLTVCSYTEEFLLLYFLRDWRADVRGLYWILTERSIAAE